MPRGKGQNIEIKATGGVYAATRLFFLLSATSFSAILSHDLPYFCTSSLLFFLLGPAKIGIETELSAKELLTLQQLSSPPRRKTIEGKRIVGFVGF